MEKTIKVLNELFKIIIILFISFLSFYAFVYIPGKERLLPFIISNIPDILLLASVLYIFILFSRNREKIFIKILFLLIFLVPVLFLSYQLKDSSEKSTEIMTFPAEDEFYENSMYTVYTSETGNSIIKKGLLISKEKKDSPFTEINNTDVKPEGKTGFSIPVNKEDMLFSNQTDSSRIITAFFRLLENYSNSLKEEASENSILLLIKITILIGFLLSLTAAFSISRYPVINFSFYSAVIIPVLFFLTVYQRLLIPEIFLSKIPAEAAENWGYLILVLFSVIFIPGKMLRGRVKRVKRR